MRAMTWFDHETESVWSQPWGMAIAGPLEGTRLLQIPARIMPWDAWLADHPDTQVLKSGRSSPRRQFFTSRYVIGIALGEDAKAYPFTPVSKEGVINDFIGDFPVLVFAGQETKAVHSYLRQVGEQALEFELQEGVLVDVQTGSVWNVARGIATDGPLRGEVLRSIPYITSYDWAWEDFYPHSEFYPDD